MNFVQDHTKVQDTKVPKVVKPVTIHLQLCIVAFGLCCCRRAHNNMLYNMLYNGFFNGKETIFRKNPNFESRKTRSPVVDVEIDTAMVSRHTGPLASCQRLFIVLRRCQQCFTYTTAFSSMVGKTKQGSGWIQDHPWARHQLTVLVRGSAAFALERRASRLGSGCLLSPLEFQASTCQFLV